MPANVQMTPEQQKLLQQQIEKEQNRKMIDRFIADVLRDSKKVRFIIFRQMKSLIARSMLAGTVQLLRVLGLNHDKMALDELEQQFKTTPLVVGNQSFSAGRKTNLDKYEFLVMENLNNTDVDRCVFANFDKMQMIVGFNITKSSVIDYEGEVIELAKVAAPLMKIELEQPQPPVPRPVFCFEHERLKNSSQVFIYDGYLVERANDYQVEPNRDGNRIALVYVSPNLQSFEWIVQMLVALQKRFDGLVLFTVIAGLRPDNIRSILQISPFISKLNLVYDSLQMNKRFFFHIGDDKSKNYAELGSGSDPDDLYQQLLDIISGGQDPKPVEEDNNLILNQDNSGFIFMGIPLYFANPDEPPVQAVEDQQPKDDTQQEGKRMRRSLRMNAISDELYEADEDEEKKEADGMMDQPVEEHQEQIDDGEKQRDPLNTYVVTFWNPRDKMFPEKMREYLYLADTERLRQVNQENLLVMSQSLRDGDEKPVQQKDDELKPYLRLYTCINGSRQITLPSFEKKIPNLRENSKIILDDDWVYEKVHAMFQASEEEVKLGMFYVFNRQFKQIMETADFDEMALLVKERGQRRRAPPKQE